jgi:hypothetical protein
MKAQKVYESIKDILKPKTKEEVQKSIDEKFQQMRKMDNTIDMIDFLLEDIDPYDHDDFLKDIIDKIPTKEFDEIATTCYKDYLTYKQDLDLDR